MWLLCFIAIKALIVVIYKGIKKLIQRRRKNKRGSDSYALVDNTMEPFIEENVQRKKYLFC